MHLYLVQHGESVAEAEDPDRPLTAAGKADMERLGAFLAACKVTVGHIVHSGKRRTQASAEVMQRALGGTVPVEERPRMLPGDSTEWLTEVIVDWRDDALVVGHQPFISRLVSRLVLGAEQPAIVDVTPGTVVCLSRRGATRAWFIAWMLRPELLRR
jgi:phosphohistidine phosphatase